MRVEERNRARELRRQGCSVGEIAKRLRCSKSSVSHWVRDIRLTPSQVRQLASNQARGRAFAADHPNSPRQFWERVRRQYYEAAAKELPERHSSLLLKAVGSALYWAEGRKCTTSLVGFSNSDPEMIALMMEFFKKICKVPESKFRGVVNIHPHLDADRAKEFWSKVSGIPLTQFHKTQTAVSRASQGKRDSLPLGTFGIVFSDVRLKSRIRGWIGGMGRWGNHAGRIAQSGEHSAYIREVTGSIPVSPIFTGFSSAGGVY